MWYVLVAVLFYLAGMGTGALVWRHNAKRFETLLQEGKSTIGSYSGNRQSKG